MQRAALGAVAGVSLPVSLVAIRASTGQVLAFASYGNGLAADDALVGRYPTGSTFKIITAAALLNQGLTPSSPATCPASIVVDGKELTTFSGEADATVDTLASAFARSCNTAFSTLGTALSTKSVASAATRLGLGLTPRLGRKAFGGTVATASSAYDRAVLASDGGTTLASPLAMASVAATVDSGSLHPPRLTAGTSADKLRSPHLAQNVITGLQSMMATVVTNGTASGQGLPEGTHAKTGTAVFAGSAEPRTVYAWLVGYRGDIAFAVVVVGGAQGGSAAGPVAAQFLTSIGKR